MKPETEAELEIHQRRINNINREIADLMNARHEAERKVFELRNRQPVSTVVLAARHLDPAEGGMRPGQIITGADISALNTVIRFVAGHKDC